MSTQVPYTALRQRRLVYLFDRLLTPFARPLWAFFFVVICGLPAIAITPPALQCTTSLDEAPAATVAGLKKTSIEGLARKLSASPAQYKALQSTLTAPLGHIFEIESNGPRKLKAVKKEPEFSIEQKNAVEFLKSLPEKISPELETFLQEELSTTEVSPDAIMIKLPYQRVPRPEFSAAQNLFQTFLHERFQFIARNLTTWVYQLNGLERYAAETSGTMYDENIGYGIDGFQPDQFLLFDKTVWNIQKRYIETIWDRLQKQQIPQDELGNLMELQPFLPLSGIIFTKSKNGSVELKRYFRNDYEDPFDLLNLPKKDDFVLRHRLLLLAVQSLPPLTPLEIHSHSRAHTMAYTKWDFDVGPESSSPLYSGVKIQILTSTRERMIEAIKGLLAQQSAVPSP